MTAGNFAPAMCLYTISIIPIRYFINFLQRNSALSGDSTLLAKLSYFAGTNLILVHIAEIIINVSFTALHISKMKNIVSFIASTEVQRSVSAIAVGGAALVNTESLTTESRWLK